MVHTLRKFTFALRNKMLLCAMFSAFCSLAQTPIEHPDRHSVTLISPYYFGPNAFPIPNILDGTVSRELRAEVATDYFWGKRGDRTCDLSLNLNIPLFSDRVNISAWMPVTEWWKNSDENIDVCRLADKADDNPRIKNGHGVGDVFVSTDVQLLREGKCIPALAVRLAFKTASSDDDYCTARFYDSPGYYFDLSAGKNLLERNDGFLRGVRCATSFGFLCWQTDNGRQNDAVMYGIQLKILTRAFALSETFGGYSGWENGISNGGKEAHDRPMSLKTRLSIPVKKFEIVSAYQYGLRDYPYQQFTIGIAYNYDIISLISK